MLLTQGQRAATSADRLTLSASLLLARLHADFVFGRTGRAGI